MAAMLASYSQEEPIGKADSNELNTITLQIPAMVPVTYAADLHGTAAERQVNDIAIFMLKGGKLEKIFNGTDANYNSATGTAQIAVEGTSPRDFYIIGNPNMTNIPAAGFVQDAATTSEAQLQTLMSNTLGFTTVYERLKTPFLMATPKIANITPSNGLQVTTPKLVRRVARFDVHNDPAVSGIVLKTVAISNAKQHVGVLANNTQTVSGLVEEMTLNFVANKAEAAFYLYPTELDAATAGKTVITFTTTDGQTYVVKTAKTIEANKIYSIRTSAPVDNRLNFTIVVEDWDSENDMEIEKQVLPFAIHGTPVASAGTTLVGTTWSNVASGATLEVTFNSASSSVIPDGTTGDLGLTWVNQILTYGGASYRTTYRIKANDNNGGTVTFKETKSNSSITFTVAGI